MNEQVLQFVTMPTYNTAGLILDLVIHGGFDGKKEETRKYIGFRGNFFFQNDLEGAAVEAGKLSGGQVCRSREFRLSIQVIKGFFLSSEHLGRRTLEL